MYLHQAPDLCKGYQEENGNTLKLFVGERWITVLLTPCRADSNQIWQLPLHDYSALPYREKLIGNHFIIFNVVTFVNFTYIRYKIQALFPK